MKDRKINVIVMNNNQGAIEVRFKTIDDDLDVFYKIIGCTCIDIVEREINGKRYNIICDDEFLLKSVPVVTMKSFDDQEILCGNLIICPLNEDNTEELGSFKNWCEMYTTYMDILDNQLQYDF